MIPNLPDSGLTGRHVVLGVTGGIAAYKAVEVCRLLSSAGAEVAPVLTPNATRFVGTKTFDALASQPARIDLWDSPEPSPHTDLARWADIVVVAPATARLLASYAHGLSDDLLTTTLLATTAPVLLAPAMHTEMWEHPAVIENVKLLRERSVNIVEPESGPLAGGDIGPGRLAEPAIIFGAVRHIFSPNDLSGRHVLVTAGGTREALDPVRFFGNRSSGRQGHAIAVEAAARGAHVVLVTTSSMHVPEGLEVVSVESAEQMRAAVMAHLSDVDVVVMAAAVADFKPVLVHEQKVKKESGAPRVVLEPTTDILSEVSVKRRGAQIVVGFAAETENVESNAIRKLDQKNLDIVVANDVSAPGAGFDADTNAATIIERGGWRCSTGVVNKRTVARILLDRVVEALGSADC